MLKVESATISPRANCLVSRYTSSEHQDGECHGDRRGISPAASFYHCWLFLIATFPQWSKFPQETPHMNQDFGDNLDGDIQTTTLVHSALAQWTQPRLWPSAPRQISLYLRSSDSLLLINTLSPALTFACFIPRTQRPSCFLPHGYIRSGRAPSRRSRCENRTTASCFFHGFIEMAESRSVCEMLVCSKGRLRVLPERSRLSGFGDGSTNSISHPCWVVLIEGKPRRGRATSRGSSPIVVRFECLKCSIDGLLALFLSIYHLISACSTTIITDCGCDILKLIIDTTILPGDEHLGCHSQPVLPFT
jgi:hypothetical protein